MNTKMKIKKAADGLQQIKAKEATTRGLISQGVGTAAEAALPGMGGAATSALESLSSFTRDENGLYKNKAVKALDVLNPVTAISRVVKGVGLFAKGDFKSDIDGEDQIRDAIAKEKKQKEADAYYRTLKPDAALQMSQYKEGGKYIAVKPIEMEGKEPHFSKKVNGKRTLKFYDPNGPTHEQGGIATIAEEGDAIVTAKKGMGAKAVKAHQAGDTKSLEKIINTMPEDNPTKKKRGGVRAAKPTYVDPLLAKLKQNTPEMTSTLNGFNRPINQATLLAPNAPLLPSREVSTKSLSGVANPITDSVFQPKASPSKVIGAPMAAAAPKSKLDAITEKGANALQAGASIYNLGQGLFGKVDKTSRRAYNPEQVNYEDGSQASRRASEAAMKSQIANARNLSGGVAGNARANSKQAYAENYERQSQLNEGEVQRKLNVDNANVGVRNDAKLRNNAMNERADDLDMQNAAKKQEALSKGIEGIGGLAANSVLTKNTIAKEAGDREMLGQLYKNFTMGPDGKLVFKKMRKGTKSIKK